MELNSTPATFRALLAVVENCENRAFALLQADIELVHSLEAKFKFNVESVPVQSSALYSFSIGPIVSLFYSPVAPNARFLYELDVHLELIKTNFGALREAQFLQKYEEMAFGGYWSLLKVSYNDPHIFFSAFLIIIIFTQGS